jgi:glycine/D-amino acid oxidase-like deaminating enzyme
MNKNFSNGNGSSPFFITQNEQNIYPGLDKDTACDVLIVGGGITGLITAYYFLNTGASVCVAEGKEIAGGSTRYSSAILQYDADYNLNDLKKRFGTENALYLLRQSIMSLDNIENIIKSINSDCGFKRRDSFYFSDKIGKKDDIQNEYKLRKYSGFEVEYLDKQSGLNMFSFNFEDGVYSKNAGAEMNPIRFAKDLAAYLSLNNVSVYENTEIDTVFENSVNGGFTSQTSKGHKITSKAICDCRGQEAIKRYPNIGSVYTFFTVATQPVLGFNGWYNRCNIKDDYCPNVYLSTTSDNRLIISGEDTRYIKPDGTFAGINMNFYLNYKYNYLEDVLRDMFIGIEDIIIEDRYTSSVIHTKDKLPYIGEDVSLKKFYYAYCYNHSGILSSDMAGRYLSGLYSGKTIPNMNLFKMP